VAADLNGDGTFRAPVSYSVGIFPVPSVAVLDANGDGRPDIAAANINGVVILTNTGNGTFSSSTFPISAGVQGVTMLDAHGDGELDIAGFGSTMSVRLNTTPLNAAPSARPNPPHTDSVPAPSPAVRPITRHRCIMSLSGVADRSPLQFLTPRPLCETDPDVRHHRLHSFPRKPETQTPQVLFGIATPAVQ
jgi:hypothetical protein